MKGIRRALFLTSALSLAFGIVFLITMLFSSNAGLPGLPEHSRLSDINYYHEGWIETISFISIGIYGVLNLKRLSNVSVE